MVNGEHLFARLETVKRCDGCGREYRPSSGHRLCPACRRQASKDRCACGQPKQPTSSTCRSCQATSGVANGNWRGGSTRHHAGYIMRHVPEHPRARRRPYVFEHILVMEEVLGRHLLPDETVHHLNGVKDDNRPENLELWVKPQPAGIRASNAVAWAREIIARYGAESDSSNNAPDLSRALLELGGIDPPSARRSTSALRPFPDHTATAGAPPGQESTRGARCRVFPRCQRSFPPSVVSPYGPPLLLLPGCSGLAPCAVTGHWCSLRPSRN